MSYLAFKGVTEFGHTAETTRLEFGLIYWLNWCLLNIGAFNNVNIPTSGSYGGRYDQLSRTYDPYYNNGQVWQGVRSNWVWESGLQYGYQPTQFSGVKVNGTFYSSSTTGVYAHKVDYPQGRVVFDNALPSGSSVQASFAFRDVLVTDCEEPFVKELLFNSYRPDSQVFAQFGSGDWSILARERIQLPAVAVEAVPRRSFKGYQLGANQWLYQDVIFHVIAETKFDRDKLVDILTGQNDCTLYFLNPDAMSAATGFPLDIYGQKGPNCKTFPELIDSFRWSSGFMHDTKTTALQNLQPNLWTGAVRTTFDFIVA